jgi:recombination protein RecA
MRKLSAVINRSNTSAIFINQIREKIGVMFGSPQTTPGGRALKFYSSVRIDIRRIGQIKDGGDVVGNRTLAKVVKNKCAPPFRNAEFDIVYNKGISWIGDVLDHAVAAKIVNKAGAWYSFQKTRLGQGRENAIRLLETEPTLLLEIETAVLAKLNESAQNA